MAATQEVKTVNGVVVLGNIKAEDDFCHTPTADENYNESVYFNFFDREKNTGGFVRMGNRVNEGQAEMTICLYQEDGTVLFVYKRPKIDNNDGWDAGGLKVSVNEALHEIKTTYKGSVMVLTDPMAMLDPKAVYSSGATKQQKVTLSVDHTSCGAMFGYSADNYWDSLPPADREEAKKKNKNNFARNHFEQHMHIKGTLQIGDKTVSLEGNGLRDHSWGPRYWQETVSYRFINGAFGDDFGFGFTTAAKGAGGNLQIGKDKYAAVTDVQIATMYTNDDSGRSWPGVERPATVYQNHREFVMTVRAAKEGITLKIKGTVVGFMPLRSRRNGQHTYIGEGMTRFELLEATGLPEGVSTENRVGYGMSEYLDQGLAEVPTAAGTAKL